VTEVLRTGDDHAVGGPQRLNSELLAQGSEVIRPFFELLDNLRQSVEAEAVGADPAMTKKLRALARKIDAFEASVTLIGQVKAGKTALTNVLSGNVSLLPSDVNP
jgi:hypothetical protein